MPERKMWTARRLTTSAVRSVAIVLHGVLYAWYIPVARIMRNTASHTPQVNGMKGCLILVIRLVSTWVRVRVGVGLRIRARG